MGQKGFGIDFNVFDGLSPIGKGFAIPNRIKVSYDGPEVPYKVELVVEWDGTRALCTSLTCEAKEKGEEVTTEGMRKVPVARFIRTGMTGFLHKNVTHQGEDSWQPARLPRKIDASRGPSEETLEWVAVIYRLGVATKIRNPTQGVADALELPRSTAARWVMTARQKGLLGPTVEGRAGEMS